ncbi:MAG: Holliday junction resolvase [Alphaproteobacteria bacterium]|jgi:putative Holliday junction resolvase|nr:Holliday junction resolvase [Alphaproteobacteria bacterium]
MPLYDIKDFAGYRGRGRRIMGVDLGEKTIGIAISDPTWQIATPVTVLRRTNRNADMASLLNLVDQYQAFGIVVGLPINMNGSLGPQAGKMREFAQSLSELSETFVILWDERLSTMAVNRTLLDADMSRKRRGEVVDKLAAAYILQGALDRLRAIETSSLHQRDS